MHTQKNKSSLLLMNYSIGVHLQLLHLLVVIHVQSNFAATNLNQALVDANCVLSTQFSAGVYT